jgi:hypothetical protein
VGGQISSSHETLTAGYFPFDGLPPLSRNRTSERYLAEVLAHVRNNHRPAVFD